jgi:signal transduction histidine kinase
VGIEVSDTGPGISADLRGRLFEEFFRARGATGDTRGHGLGLAISRRLARLLGGDVNFRDADPHGAIFTLWIDAGENRAASTPHASA